MRVGEVGEEKRGGECGGDERVMSIDEAVDDEHDDDNGEHDDDNDEHDDEDEDEEMWEGVEHAGEVDVDSVGDFFSRSRSSRQNIWPFLHVAMKCSAADL
jgi:hypothetical protein